MYDKAKSVALANMWVAFASFFVAIILGLYQVMNRSGLFPEIESHQLYFASVSTHGVLMGFVLTTFFVMGFGYYTATTTLKRPLWNKGLAWIAFLVALGGTVMAAVPLLTGKASVLYTFYPPLQADPVFYIGATLLVVGSWLWCLEMIMSVVTWKRDNPGKVVPLAMYGTTANAIMWLWTSAGVGIEMLFQLIPWSLGLMDTVDPGLARTLFSWTLHAIVYFWLFPAYIAMYTILPKVAGGRVFSDEMGRVAFIMLLVISVPIGFHHLYMDPQQAAGFKFLHMLGTFAVAIPTLLTGFTVLASLEGAGRLRGGKGLFGWIGALDWKEPIVVAGMLALFMLIAGGFGGMINASYQMNTLVHNTQWVTGHFHLIFAGTTVIMYLAVAYHLWPKLTGRRLASRGMAVLQLWLWTIGMLVLTLPWHVLGILGQPRRISSTPYDSPLVEQWGPHEAAMVVGGAILLFSALLFVLNLLLSHVSKKMDHVDDDEWAVAVYQPLSVPKPMNGFALWNSIIAVWMVIAYGYPVLQFLILDTHGSLAWGY
ncbi:MAG: b(o/a)3-type cytochrome-c oxidase subunit 1 [Gammaproteobacteria bacterium]|nr:b(o/a)3-type cytochrome-c oxidase subunit 1 [Gammaproteobacteria bacterium]MCP5299203.1 b(o/a)3-type cytochrome-c oxidase subunit 1 [Chromatiaceae bacterium]